MLDLSVGILYNKLFGFSVVSLYHTKTQFFKEEDAGYTAEQNDVEFNKTQEIL